MAELCSETRGREGDPQAAAGSLRGSREEPERLRSAADPCAVPKTARESSERIPCHGLPLQQLSRVRELLLSLFLHLARCRGGNNFILGGGSQLLPALLAQEQGSSP